MEKELMTKLDTAEKYSWYILTALEYKCSQLSKSINGAKEHLAKPLITENDKKYLTDTRRSMESLLSYCEQSYTEYKQALSELKTAGFC